MFNASTSHSLNRRIGRFKFGKLPSHLILTREAEQARGEAAPARDENVCLWHCADVTDHKLISPLTPSGYDIVVLS